ncbi:MarR family winged helix-turn-helix transcriptional regulator [Spartinivicinus poritis]|uniref:MarR family transcriptional regulator n=1 Tax=Spartinivicinus poritis TaxID=2994640 RepID=A0ABT5UDR4_9GAMM|nr:MarR family transcriptional regulator [Spartinivicinus sp. A2-2]MDE1464447.1 MarR family transcriptional regulator [Spartinivicinus sp. A2-2]
MSAPKLNDQLCFALYAASNAVTRYYRPLLEPLGLTYPQFVVLMALWEDEGVSISQLATKTGLSKPTMTPLLKRLEQKALIERQAEPGNDRQKCIVLTEEGRRLSTQGDEIAQKVFCATGLTEQQARQQIEFCQQLITTFE